ncbi:krueppel-like factor 2 [Caerostris extrusa]|uniref:Krueppel-like factor 2 n=1 Tax=Caerostris extrusa TaxID=172846 RepID=A0AAV4TML4_CAEEX|nr:krueppel-like factor 2 [Caerostris extrusa]
MLSFVTNTPKLHQIQYSTGYNSCYNIALDITWDEKEKSFITLDIILQLEGKMWQDIESVLLGDMTLNTSSGYTEIRNVCSNQSSFTPTTDDSGGGSMSSVHQPITNNNVAQRGCPQYNQSVSLNFFITITKCSSSPSYTQEKQ